MTLLITLIFGVAFWVMIANLRERVAKLEKSAAVPDGSAAHQSAPVSASAPPVPYQPAHDPQAPQHRNAPENDVVVKFFAWAKTDWLMKLGALFLLLGFGWFVSYAFANDWIGPMGRIAVGLLAGAGILLGGHLRMAINTGQGGVLVVLGSATIILTLFGARFAYDFFTPLSALALMFLSAAYVAFVSVQYRSQPLAIAGLILAASAPLLIDAPAPSLAGLFSYLTVVIGSTLAVVLRERWPMVTLSALGVVGLYSVHYFANGVYGFDADAGLLFSFVLTSLFFGASLVGLTGVRGEAHAPHLAIGGLSGLFLFGWVVTAAPEAWQSMLLSAWALVFASAAYVVWLRLGAVAPLAIYGSVGMGLIAAATAIELSGPALTVAFMAEAGIVALVGRRLVPQYGMALLLPMIVPMLLSFESATSYRWSEGVVHDDFAVIALMAAMLLGLGFFWKRIPLTENAAPPSQGRTEGVVLGVAGAVYALLLVWLSLHGGSWIAEDTATMLSLTLYTLLGMYLYFEGGRANGSRAVRIFAACLLGFVAGRLLLVEVWEMALAGRIITFFTIGALFISTAFIRRGGIRAEV